MSAGVLILEGGHHLHVWLLVYDLCNSLPKSRSEKVKIGQN